MIFEIILFFITAYIVSSIVIVLHYDKKFFSKIPNKEAVAALQDKSFQFAGFLFVSISVLMTDERIFELLEPMSLFSLGFFLVLISILITEIKTSNIVPFLAEKLNYASLLTLAVGLLLFFIKKGINVSDSILSYFFAYMFILFFILLDLYKEHQYFRRAANDKQLRNKGMAKMRKVRKNIS